MFESYIIWKLQRALQLIIYVILGKLICVKKLHKNSQLTAISAAP